MHLIKNDGLIKFNQQLPIYNFFYPLQAQNIDGTDLKEILSIYNQLDTRKLASRALYFHIPFCETICNFCPFVRGMYKGDEIIEKYVQALIREIEIKSQFKSVVEVPIGAIFFGGGTPSLLSPEQILRIGNAIHNYFDLSQMQEFSFEAEVKSVNRDKVAAMKEIGVTHARFGLQSFNQFYRDLFDLTATLDQIYNAVEIFREYLEYISFDILYGMNGQTEDDFIRDLQKAIALGTPTIDVYPIDHVVTQIKLHQKSKEAGLSPKTAMSRFSMNVLLNQYMRANGFLPHNGHGYVRATAQELSEQPVVTNSYSFKYHEYVYGHDDREIIGFGVGAISSLNNYVITNTSNRSKYIQSVLEEGIWEMLASKHDKNADASRGLILHLPYHGFVKKSRVDLQSVYPETLEYLQELVNAELIEETPDEYKITQVGWYWYVNIMYYLIPKHEKRILNSFIAQQLRQTGREVTKEQILLMG
ncbi:radical SAM protein [Trichocoleus sp. DQ-A3]|uniref:coproporphyrinogen-III oxidase family protein n=1 Tax=Cyanophyceae TaxID=3028117 RepID=UPI0016836B27|nr:radical SAM protein [Coleofasciculus sp. FACHB-125]MBD1903674.1 radical SAM protein [Coleofasciculus sp. FACHB-125]